MSPERSNRSEVWLEQMVEFVIMYLVPLAFIVIILFWMFEDEQRWRGAGAVTIVYILTGYLVAKIKNKNATKKEGTTK